MPRRTEPGRRLLALAVLVMVPVVLLVLLPAVLGLDRYVVTDDSMGHAMGRGSVVLARDVPAGDLRPGDVISFSAPGQGRVTHRIVAIQDAVATTRGDAAAASDRRRIPLDQPTYARVELHVPWIGYPFVVVGGWVLGGMATAALVAAVVLGIRRRRSSRPGLRRPPSRHAPLGVG